MSAAEWGDAQVKKTQDALKRYEKADAQVQESRAIIRCNNIALRVSGAAGVRCHDQIR